MNKRSDTLILSLLLLAVLVVALNAGLAFHAEGVLAQSEAAVVNTWEAINTVERTLNDVESIETGARGYLLSENSRYLQPYQAGLQALPADLEHFGVVTASNPTQQRRVEDLRRAVTARTDLLQLQIHLQQSGRRDAALALVRQGTGQEQMNRLRAVVGSMQQEEAQRLILRELDSARARTEARFTIGLASALDLVLILLSGAWLARERRLREQARVAAERLAKLQSIIDAGISQLGIAELRVEMLTRLRTVAQADAGAIYSYHANGLQLEPSLTPEAYIIVQAVVGLELQTGMPVRVRPGGPIDQASREASAIKLTGEGVFRLPIHEFSHAMNTLLILPLRVDSRPIGFIILGQHRQNAFSSDDEELLVVAADRVALAIDRARLFAQETHARQQAEAAADEVRVLNTELEERVQQRTIELETTNRELEAFSYSVSHDLRAPLRSVDGFSVALSEDYGALLEGDGQHYLARIRVGVQRMGGLIDALLQLSRITRADLSPESINLSEIATGVADELTQAHPDRPIEFVIQPDLRALGDKHLLGVVFDNMFGNAVKFTSRIDHPRIEFGWSPAEQSYFIRDNGAGFDQQYAGKLFVAFQRLHGDKDFQGSGIGLATVARVIHRHHGTIRAEGEVGEGATFWFTLQAARLRDTAPEPESTP